MWDYALSTYKEEVRNISVRNIRCKYYVDFDFKYSVPQHTYTISECTHYPRYLINKFDCIWGGGGGGGNLVTAYYPQNPFLSLYHSMISKISFSK